MILLDVDCLPAPHMIERYLRCAAQDTLPRLLCGPLAYLPPPPPQGYDLDILPAAARPHPGRPCPAMHEVLRGGDHRVFWSLSFALRSVDWPRVGGFCELYRGYGGEDTDSASGPRPPKRPKILTRK